MTPRIIVGIVALACGSACGIFATLTNFEMINKVNDKLPDTEKFEQLGWYLSKTQKLRRGYKTLYPGGRLVLRVNVLTATMFVCFLITAWGLGIIAR